MATLRSRISGGGGWKAPQDELCGGLEVCANHTLITTDTKISINITASCYNLEYYFMYISFNF